MKLKHLFFAVFSWLCVQTSFGQFTTNAFAPKVDFSVGAGPNIYDITSADLNNDGKKDIITANYGTHFIGIFVNNSSTGIINSSSFSYFTLASISTSGITPVRVKAADLNGDNKPEIIVGYSSGSNRYFSIFFNQFSGTTFNSSSFTRFDFSAENAPGGVSIADYDLDGKPDIAIANFNESNISIFRNTSSLTTLSFAPALVFVTGASPGEIGSADLDNDGKIDLVIPNFTSKSVTIFKNTTTSAGNISVSLIGSSVNYLTTLIEPDWMKIADFDNNGLKDIIISNWGSNSISIFPNTSGSGISFATRVDIGLSPWQHPQDIAIADYDGDGKQDICLSIGGSSGSSVALCFKNIHSSGPISASSFSAFTTYGLNMGPSGNDAVDLDNDLRPDLVVANGYSQNISVLKNRMIAGEPTLQTSSLNISSDTGSITLNFIKGNGMRRIVIIRANVPVNENPADTSFYNASRAFGSGSQIGSGNYVVYADTGSSVTITGLTYGTNYFYSIYEYNGIGGYSNYLLTAPLTGFSKVGLPPSEAPQFNFVSYPNPFHSAVNLDFELKNSSSVTIAVFDILGREIKSGSFAKMPKGQNQLVLDETYFGNPGTYFISVYIDGVYIQHLAVKF